MSEVHKIRESGLRELARKAFEDGMKFARLSESDKSALYWQNEGKLLIEMNVLKESTK